MQRCNASVVVCRQSLQSDVQPPLEVLLCARAANAQQAHANVTHNYVSVKLTSLYCGLRPILVYPNPQ